MAYELKEGQGSLFKNEDKKTEKHPDYTGKAMVGGTLHKVAGWIKEDRNGNKYLSLKIEPKPADGGGQAAPVGNRVAATSIAKDDMPF